MSDANPLRTVFVDRSRLPAPGSSPPFGFPPIERSTLPGGLSLWTVRHNAVPLVAVTLLLRRGSAADPPGLEGLAALTADMLDEGSGDLSALQVHEALASIGAQFDTDIGSDAVALSVTLLSRYVDRGLHLLGDIAARPRLTEEDFARVRQLRLHRLMQLRDVPGAVAERTFQKLLYGDDPYGHSPIGTEVALAAISPDDVRRFHAETMTPDVATLIAVGDADHETLRRIAADAFAGWHGVARPEQTTSAPLPRAARLSVVPRPGAPQSELRIGHVAVARNTPDYHALVAANMVLGGQFVSRLNMNLREDKGFTYGARTGFDFRRRPGPFVLQVSVHTAATARAIQESLGEINAIRGARPITPDELELGIAALTRGYAKNFETADQIARAVMQIALYDLPDTYFAEFVSTLEAVTAAEATRVAAAQLHPDRLITLVVGDLDAIGRDLEQLDLGSPVVLSPEAF